MRHVFIVNPAAGSRNSTWDLTREVLKTFPQGGAEVRYTTVAGEARRWSRELADSGEEVRIYACGGDGTLNEVVNGAAGYDRVAVTNVPMGTGNDFLRLFGREGRKRFRDLEALRDGPQTPMDVMDCNGFLGLDIICVGLDARVAEQVDRYKTLPTVGHKGAYILSLVNAVGKGITAPLEVHMGPTDYTGKATLLCICNGRYYGGGFCPVPEAMPDDGVLDMLLLRDMSPLTLARYVSKYAAGKYKECPPELVHPWKGQEVTFSSPTELPVVVDGEVLRGREFTVKLSEKKLNFFYPADVSYVPGQVL